MLAKPPSNRGMVVLDRTKFGTSMPLMMAKLQHPSLIGRLGKECPSDLLDTRGVSRVIKITEQDRGILLNPDIKSKAMLSETAREMLGDSEVSPYTLELDYNYWSTEEILRSILPSELADVPTGFTVVGHIAHMNLRDQYLPYKHVIGQVILDKNPSIKTVVNKLDSIHSVYRTFDMEVIAGEDGNFEVEQLESNCRFRFDFRKVYWNSRLHTEHDRLVSLFEPGQAVCDPFAGVGPFAVPAGKKNVLVFASDLNPFSYEAMVNNVNINKVGQFVHPFNIDAREFIRGSTKRLLEFQAKYPTLTPPRKKVSRSKPASPPQPDIEVPKYFSHFVMNLPDSAIEFLDAFRGLYTGIEEAKDFPLPTIHVHCFHKHSPLEKEPPIEVVKSDLAERCSRALGFTVHRENMKFHDVRKVAPTKEMYCISFQLPKEVAFA